MIENTQKQRKNLQNTVKFILIWPKKEGFDLFCPAKLINNEFRACGKSMDFNILIKIVQCVGRYGPFGVS